MNEIFRHYTVWGDPLELMLCTRGGAELRARELFPDLGDAAVSRVVGLKRQPPSKEEWTQWALSNESMADINRAVDGMVEALMTPQILRMLAVREEEKLRKQYAVETKEGE